MTVSTTTQLARSPPAKPCHNCRRNRLRCDRSLPHCQKCSRRGDQCLGYGQLIRWTNVVAVRGKLAEHVGQRPPLPEQTLNDGDNLSVGLTTGQSGSSEVGLPICTVNPTLIDPLLKDLGPRHRLYINHFSELVCKDLVSFDRRDNNNPFRSVITLLSGFNYLREIILATSAMHMVTLRRSYGLPSQTQLVDALAAKGRAYRLLRHALDHLEDATQPMVFIAVVFIINFDLIESGRGSWKTHIQAAGKLITSIQSRAAAIPPGVAQLADVVIADCITYHILGSGFAGPTGASAGQAGAMGIPTMKAAGTDEGMPAFAGIDVPAALQRAAAFSYGCYPPSMLDTLYKASRLSRGDAAEAGRLVDRLRGEDIRAWVYGIRGLSPDDDREIRVSMAGAHVAATSLYIVLAVPDVVRHRPDLAEVNNVGSLTAEVLYHLAAVPVDHVLAKGLIWPTFMAGAQVEDIISRQWCLDRMRKIWQSKPWICPWGYIEAAMSMMQRVWETRDRKLAQGYQNGLNWLQEMKVTADHALIV